ncbi:uncharacterized protein LOC141811568 [Curcuma longa]|uniref:uncharacterized protein LOC141811568 n=1 Tax=Curcuma longa TaxID=136217 RepID=UPI003D9F0414
MARCVDMNRLKMFGMKSHDCHVFMQRLMSIAFHDLLPNNVWQALTELSLFFRDLSARCIMTADMLKLEKDIPVILCKLERIFPPSFFDSMEHLPVHLPYEAQLGGPVQYRWMYPFERFLRKLKNNVRNKARVEGSICNAYLVEEATSFCSYYFADNVNTRHRKNPRNYDDTQPIDPSLLSIFKFPGKPFGASNSRWLNQQEYHAARTYILLNCEEVKPYISLYEQQLQYENPSISQSEVEEKLETEFALWFQIYVSDRRLSNVEDGRIINLASGPLRKIQVYSGYYVNGFKFHVTQRESQRLTFNAGVYVKGSINNNNSEFDYYGRLEEIIEIEYPALPIKRCVLFKCFWYDPTPRTGTRIHSNYNLVEVNANKRFNKFEPFIFAVQAAPKDANGEDKEESLWNKKEQSESVANGKAEFHLLTVLPPQEVSRIGNYSSAKELWEKFLELHEGTSEAKSARKDLLRNKLINLRMMEGETVAELHAKIKELISGLSQLGESVSNRDSIRYALNAFPRTSVWSSIVDAFYISKDLEKKRRSPKKRTVRCYNCKEEGHLKDQCPNFKNQSKKKKALKATWDETSSDESEVQEYAGLALMASHQEGSTDEGGATSEESDDEGGTSLFESDPLRSPSSSSSSSSSFLFGSNFRPYFRYPLSLYPAIRRLLCMRSSLSVGGSPR